MGDQFVVFANGLVECEKLAELAVCREAHERAGKAQCDPREKCGCAPQDIQTIATPRLEEYVDNFGNI